MTDTGCQAIEASATFSRAGLGRVAFCPCSDRAESGGQRRMGYVLCDKHAGEVDRVARVIADQDGE